MAVTEQTQPAATWDDGSECARLYVEEGLDCVTIGKRLGMHPVTVRLRLDARGIGRERGSCRRYTCRKAEVERLTAAGLSQLAIAARLGINKRTVARWQFRLRVTGLSSDSRAVPGSDGSICHPEPSDAPTAALARQEGT